MANNIRIGQLIAPFGPGSLYNDQYGQSNIICGLDFWLKKTGENEISDSVRSKYLISESRLSELLKVGFFYQPPQYIRDKDDPEISQLLVGMHRFPRWYVDKISGKLTQFNLDSVRGSLKPKVNKGEQWQPVRFIAVCEKGHISDFPWKSWSGCTCQGNDQLFLHDAGGPDLRSVKVQCKRCHKGKDLSGAMSYKLAEDNTSVASSGLNEKSGLICSGETPWLGNISSSCDSNPVGALINQSNIYMAKTISSIYLPFVGEESRSMELSLIFQENETSLNRAKINLELGEKSEALNSIRFNLDGLINAFSDDQLIDALKNLSKGQTQLKQKAPAAEDTVELAYRRAEYTVLNTAHTINPDELRIVKSKLPKSLASWFFKVHRIERLRETRVFYGFDRLIRAKRPLDGMPTTARDQLFKKAPMDEGMWLPAIKNYGEGIYLELKEEAINQWLDNQSLWLQTRLNKDFVANMAEQYLLNVPAQLTDRNWRWAARYLLVHTLSHVLMKQLVFECGYSSAALKERLYVSSDNKAPMAAILIYTASGDADGSLGGLVRQGQAELLEPLIRRAIDKASWCSADPVCSEDLGGRGSQLANKAACHACVLLPETSCEAMNNGLDRAMLVGEPESPENGFLSHLLNQEF
ncbi:DUF1998 domain-containing protein [Thalassolituus oleivorans]|uniref:DUF1998 domain-containing protein n=1 Tax=Thalassolituus oleivorans TaxID=187493 RepID=UPI00042DCFAC|nr:DUF1998 domain-containing protein [Thalassolituus oleivorans]AHK17955.1 hypothetical protein R615_17490 [Thalassolituus oleivorans R6-15]